MEVKLLKRKSWTDEGGVSEIIGNILILMITVVLFSGIMMFVNQMPVPELTTKADFAASVDFDDLGSTATLTVTHIGGATMEAPLTVILVSVDEETWAWRLSEDTDFEYAEWAMGTQWVKSFTDTTYSSSISVTIVDDESHNAVWTSQVSGGMGGTPPIVLQRYVDSNADTPTVDPVKEYDDFTLFVKVTDLDKDLESVWVDSSSLVNGSVVLPFNSPTSGLVPADGGWFEWEFTDVADDSIAIDGKTLKIFAEDAAGHTTEVGYELSVIELPTELQPIYTYEDTGEGGIPAYITHVSDGQGFGVYGENGTTMTANTSDPRTNFARGANVFVRVASTIVFNYAGGNDLTMTDLRTKTDYTYLLTWNRGDIYDPFYNFPYGGSAMVYEATFNTSGLLPGTYTMHMLLQESGFGDNVFDTYETLYITDTDSPITYYPNMWTFQDSGYSILWGHSRTTTYNASSLNYKLYVGMYVQDAQASPAPSLGEIRILDMTGGTQLYGPPGSDSMISAVSKLNNTAYVFSIDLRLNNGDNWKSGTNAYTLQISQFSDENEGIYIYSKQIYVKASLARSDFFLGTNGVYSTKGGVNNFISPEYVYYVENNNFFTTRTLFLKENAPSTSPMYYNSAMALGDLDDDGDMDLLVGSNMDKAVSYDDLGQLLYFENSMNTYGVWQAPSVITRPDDTESKIKWIDTGDINGDGDTDFAYANDDHQVIIFNNTYGAVGKVFNTYNSTNDGIRKIALEDMTGDGKADLIVLALGKVYMYDLTKWGLGLFATIPNPAATLVSNIEDFDIADMNNDGMLDIITADPNSASNDYVEGVWVNNYTANQNPDEKVADTGEDVLQFAGTVTPGTLPNTLSYEDDEAAMKLSENETGEGAIGRVSVVITMESPLSTYTDQQLVVRARVSPGSQEVFYVWYSTGSDPVTAKYTPVMVITGSSYVNYTFNLPASVANSPQFYVNITDSSGQLGLETEWIDIDYIGIQSNRFGSYWENPGAFACSNRYQVTDVNDPDEVYRTARAINFDGLGDGRLEVVVGKLNKWVVYDYKTPVPGWIVDNSNTTTVDMYVHPADAAMEGRITMQACSPTLIKVEDVNGDGYDDVIVAWEGVEDTDMASILRLYLNVDPTYTWEIDVKDIYAGMLEGTGKGSITGIEAGDIFNRS